MPGRSIAGSQTAPPNQPSDLGARSGGRVNDARVPGWRFSTKAPRGKEDSIDPAAITGLSEAANQPCSRTIDHANLSQPDVSSAPRAGLNKMLMNMMVSTRTRIDASTGQIGRSKSVLLQDPLPLGREHEQRKPIGGRGCILHNGQSVIRANGQLVRESDHLLRRILFLGGQSSGAIGQENVGDPLLDQKAVDRPAFRQRL